jgi:protein ImuB
MFSVILIPDFCLQSVLRYEPKLWLRPVALLDEREKNAVVFQMTSAAREAGICEGLTAPQALARCNDVLLKSRSRSQEQIVRELLLQTAYGFSPRIEATDDGVCTMDLQGLSLFREANANRISEWADKIITAFAQAGGRVCVGIAQTPSLALHAARHARPFLFVDDAAQFISRLPFQSLEPTPEILDILQRWGIRTVGEFTALGKDKLAERLGQEGIELFDRASIETIRPLDCITPSETFSETMEFETEIESLPPLLFILNRFVEQLACRTGLCHFVISQLTLRLRLASGDDLESVLKVPTPTGNKEVLFRMLQTHLENVQTDSPIVALELLTMPCRIEIHQFDLFSGTLRDPNQFAETLARLSALCGADNVGTPVLPDTHRPDAFQIVRPDFENATVTATVENRALGLKLRRFRPAPPIQVQSQEGAPISVQASQAGGRVEQASGPWRTSGDWWEQEKLWNRDEWDIRTRDGSLYRIYRENENWFLEGVYD